MNRRSLLFLLVILLASLSWKADAQKVAIKTNLAADALLNPNIGAEIGLAPKWSLDAEGQLNLWILSGDKRWKHWAVQPELRYWLCDRFAGHFFGVHLHGGQFNIGGIDNSVSFLGTDFSKLSDSRFQGWFAGAGIAYGYDWIINSHWNFEAEIGIGYSYSRYDQFRCAGCGRRIREDVPHDYFGITRVALNLVYLF